MLPLPALPSAPGLDLRSEAIGVCAMWSEALKRALPSLTNRRGLVRRSALVRLAQSLESTVQGEGFAHELALQARLACLDWIRARISQGPRFVAARSTFYLGRFIWGYIEQTDAFENFFSARKQGREPKLSEGSAVPRSADGSSSHVCMIGAPYGAISLSSLFRGSAGVKGRGRWPYLVIDGRVFAVLAKNRHASHLLWLEDERTRLGLRNAPLSDHPGWMVEALHLMSEWGRASTRPAFVLQCGQGPRFLLHLKPARHVSGTADLSSRLNWLAESDSLLVALTGRLHRNFIPSDRSDNWGSWETLEWHLTPLPASARTHLALFMGSRQ